MVIGTVQSIVKPSSRNMDLSKLIKDKSKVFEGTSNYPGIECVLNHIKIAKSTLAMGREAKTICSMMSFTVQTRPSKVL